MNLKELPTQQAPKLVRRFTSNQASRCHQRTALKSTSNQKGERLRLSHVLYGSYRCVRGATWVDKPSSSFCIAAQIRANWDRR
eukprot:2655143-Amphidinium_carterae.1